MMTGSKGAGTSHPRRWTPADMLLLAARVGMASMFLFSGLEKIFKYSEAVGFASAFSIPFASQTMPLAILLEIGGAVALLVPRLCRMAGAVLAVWVLLLGIWFHRFWSVPPGQWQMMIDDFFHHFVMAGGLLYVAVFGAYKPTRK